MAQRHFDNKPLLHHEHAKHTTHHDGFTDLWRRVLWVAVKAELYGGTPRGWTLVRKMVTLAGEGLELAKLFEKADALARRGSAARQES